MQAHMEAESLTGVFVYVHPGRQLEHASFASFNRAVARGSQIMPPLKDGRFHVYIVHEPQLSSHAMKQGNAILTQAYKGCLNTEIEWLSWTSTPLTSSPPGQILQAVLKRLQTQNAESILSDKTMIMLCSKGVFCAPGAVGVCAEGIKAWDYVTPLDVPASFVDQGTSQALPQHWLSFTQSSLWKGMPIDGALPVWATTWAIFKRDGMSEVCSTPTTLPPRAMTMLMQGKRSLTGALPGQAIAREGMFVPGQPWKAYSHEMAQFLKSVLTEAKALELPPHQAAGAEERKGE